MEIFRPKVFARLVLTKGSLFGRWPSGRHREILGANTRGLFSLTVSTVYVFQTFTFINYPPAVPSKSNRTFPFFASPRP